MSEPSRGGALYFGTFADDFSRWTDVVFLKKKSDLLSEYKKWLIKAQLQTGTKIKILRSDNGGKYVSDAFKALHDENGTTHQTTVPDTPQQNGVAERLNQALVEMARIMMRHKDVDHDLWADAIKTAVYIKNRVTSRALPVGKTPFELWTGNTPNISHMRVFGSTCWIVLHKSHIDGTFGDKAAKGVFLGYPDGSNAYKVILDDGKVVKARSVVFAETDETEVAEVAEKLPGDEVVEVETGLRSASDGEDVDADKDDKDDKQDDGSDKSADDNQGSSSSQDTLRRSGRARRPPAEYWRPVSLVAHEAPTTYVQAVKAQESAKWRIAMDEEMDAIRKNKTWRLKDRPASRRVLKGKWVYKVKNEVEKIGNNTTRHKGRLCFMGNRQIKGLDFNETFAPVVKFTTIRCILAKTGANGWELYQVDVKTVFLDEDLDGKVYMEQPDGYVDPTYPDKICRLVQPLYGLKQAPKMWYAKLDDFLNSQGFDNIDPDACLYLLMDDGEIIIVLVYIDDLLLVASSLAAIYQIKDALHKHFEMKHLGEAKVILGLEIRRDKALGTLKLLQDKYAAQVLENFGMAECNPIGTRLEVGLQLVKADESDDALPYREAVGSLMYLMVATRPDLAFAIGKLRRFVSCYGKEHWAAIKRVLRYVKGSMDKGLVFDKNSSCALQGFSDADWPGDHETRRSTTGFTFIFGGAAVSCGSKLQKTVPLSTMEAQYMALCEASKEAVWLNKLVQSVASQGLRTAISNGPINIKVDNSGCVDFSKNPVKHKRTKHIDIRYHFAREVITTDKVTLEHCATDDMVADPMTKELGKTKHDTHVEAMGLC